MALNYVTLILDLADGSGSPVAKGTATLSPSVQLTDSADGMDVVAPVTASFRQGSYPQVRLLATDNTGPQPAGWAWTVSFSGVPGNPASFSFFLPFSGGATQHLSALSPVSTAVTQFPANPMTAPGDMIYGGSAGVPQRLGIGGAGQVLTVGSGLPSWQNNPAGFSNPMTTLGDLIYENATPTAARLPGDTSGTRKFLRQQGTGTVSAAPAWDTLQAGDLPTGTTSAKGALQLDGTASDIQPSPGTQAAGAVGKAADAGHVHGQPPFFAPAGLTGATAASRYVGATASGAPVSGTFAVGDFTVDQTGKIWVCTVAGTPGTWTQIGGGGGAVQEPYLPGDDGLLAASWDPAANAVSSAITGGMVQLIRFNVRVAMTVSKLVVELGSAASAAASTGTFAGLYKVTGPTVLTLETGSADLGTTFAGFTAGKSRGLSLTLTTPQALAAGDIWYGALLVNMTNAPSIWQGGANTNRGYSNVQPGTWPRTFDDPAGGGGSTALPATIDISNANSFDINSFANPVWMGLV